jgi:hypothetical protein
MNVSSDCTAMRKWSATGAGTETLPCTVVGCVVGCVVVVGRIAVGAAPE